VVRAGIVTYEDPGSCKHPPGTVAEAVSQELMQP
jgi:hypothetical protein